MTLFVQRSSIGQFHGKVRGDIRKGASYLVYKHNRKDGLIDAPGHAEKVKDTKPQGHSTGKKQKKPVRP